MASMRRYARRVRLPKNENRTATSLARLTSPRGRFRQQKRNAKLRKIPWELSFTEWCELWEESGHWDELGKFTAGYVLARHGEQGPFKIGNVQVIRYIKNAAERSPPYFKEKQWVDPGEDWQHVNGAADPS